MAMGTGTGVVKCAWMVLLFWLVQYSVGIPVPSSVDRNRIWGVLAAGSNGWENYCDQASVCRAYQIFKNNGIPDSNIIVMMFDDIAYNAKNPEPGVIRTSPNGPNVYSGVLHDYTNMNMSHQNLLYVLRGEVDKLKGIGSGKALLSGPDDYVIVYMASHGGPGFMAFYDAPLTAADLSDTIEYMHSHQRYKQLVFFVEACNSGSMFYKTLSSDLGVFATTAANPFESSYATAWSDKLQTYQCLYYSCDWMKSVEKATGDVQGAEETLKQLYVHVKKEVNESHVSEYGDLDVENDTVNYFFGTSTTRAVETQLKLRQYRAAIPEATRRDVPLAILTNKILSAEDEWTRGRWEHDLQQELKLRERVRKTLQSIVEEVMGRANSSTVEAMLHQPASPNKFDCLKPVLSQFSAHCHSFSKVNYAVHVSGCLANMCDAGIPALRIEAAIKKICK